MYIPVSELLLSPTHRSLILALYKSLLRNIRHLPVPHQTSNQIEHPHREINRELQKLRNDPASYRKLLKTELEYSLQEEFKTGVPHNQFIGDILYKRLKRGVDLDEALLAVKESNEVKNWLVLLEKLVHYRLKRFRDQVWRGQNVEKMIKINERRNHNKSGLRHVSIKGPNKRPKNYNKLNPNEKLDRLASTLDESRANSWMVLCRFLKLSQQQSLIPNPFLLPNVTRDYNVKTDDLFSPSQILPGSTKMSIMKQAYDMEYVNGIIKPSLEYDINKRHYLEKLQQIVNEKGPQLVRVRMNTAGEVAIPIVNIPTNNTDKLREIALDTKWLVALYNTERVWNSLRNESLSKCGQIFLDGSVAVKRSGGFGLDERIFPRWYYDDLVEGEAIWEFIMNKAGNDLVKSNDQKEYESILQSWMEPLDITPIVLKSKFNQLRSRHSDRKTLNQAQEENQHKQNSHYDLQVRRLKGITDSLEKNRVFKHSEIVNPDKVTKTYNEYLEKAKTPTKKTFPSGIPVLERIGMGKTLGDYIDDQDYHNFKFGKTFKPRFKL